MDIKALAQKHEAFDGQVVFYILPYTSIQVGIHAEAVGSLSGEAQESDNVTLDANSAMFVFCDALTVAIDFNLPQQPDADLTALQYYWQQRGTDVIQNLHLFNALLSTRVRGAWFDAYEATRDHAFNAPGALTEPPPEDADPNAGSAGRKPKERTTSASKKS